MPSFDGLFVRNISLLSNERRTPSLPSSPATLSFYKNDEDIIALMATVTSIQRPRERKRGRVVPLLEMLYNLPQTLRDGSISWLVLPGEEAPSTIVIHKDLTTENVIRLATSRIVVRFRKSIRRHENWRPTPRLRILRPLLPIWNKRILHKEKSRNK